MLGDDSQPSTSYQRASSSKLTDPNALKTESTLLNTRGSWWCRGLSCKKKTNKQVSSRLPNSIKSITENSLLPYTLDDGLNEAEIVMLKTTNLISLKQRKIFVSPGNNLKVSIISYLSMIRISRVCPALLHRLRLGCWLQSRPSVPPRRVRLAVECPRPLGQARAGCDGGRLLPPVRVRRGRGPEWQEMTSLRRRYLRHPSIVGYRPRVAREGGRDLLPGERQVRGVIIFICTFFVF